MRVTTKNKSHFERKLTKSEEIGAEHKRDCIPQGVLLLFLVEHAMWMGAVITERMLYNIHCGEAQYEASSSIE